MYTKGIGFDIQLDSPDVHSDGKWLSFIIRQLLSNAVKYSEADDITVKAMNKTAGCMWISKTAASASSPKIFRAFLKRIYLDANEA